MKLQKFDGGLATRLDPQFLSVDQGAEYINIDNSVGSLTPVKSKLATNIEAFPFNFYSPAIDRWVGHSVKTYWAEYDNKVYSTNGVSRPEVRTATQAYVSGIVSPPAFTATGVVQAQVVTDVSFEVTSVQDPLALPNQDITYILVNKNNGKYSLPYELVITTAVVPNGLAELTEVGKKIRIVAVAINSRKKIIHLSNPRSLAIGNEGVEVFRQFNDVWYKVGTLGSETSTILDNIEDISGNPELDLSAYSPLQGTYQYVYTYYDINRGRESGPSPVSAEVELNDSGIINLTGMVPSADVTVTHKRIYRVGGTSTTFTLVAEIPNSINSYEDSIKDLDLINSKTLTTDIDLAGPETLNYVVQANAMLFAAEGTKLRYTPIGKPESWPELYFLTFASTITGLAAVYSGILVCTKDQTYLVSGSGPNSLIITPVSGDIGCISPASMQVHKGSALFVSSEGICISAGDNIQVVSKRLLGKLSLNPVDSIVVDECYYVLNSDGIIYCFDMGLNGIYKKLNLGVTSLGKQGSDLFGYAAGTLYKMFAGTAYESLVYHSPRFIEGAFTQQKLYKNIYIYSKGDIIIRVYVNDKLVTTEHLTIEDNHKIEVPQDLLRGFYLSFQVEGTGQVYEIEYLAEDA